MFKFLKDKLKGALDLFAKKDQTPVVSESATTDSSAVDSDKSAPTNSSQLLNTNSQTLQTPVEKKIPTTLATDTPVQKSVEKSVDTSSDNSSNKSSDILPEQKIEKIAEKSIKKNPPKHAEKVDKTEQVNTGEKIKKPAQPITQKIPEKLPRKQAETTLDTSREKTTYLNQTQQTQSHSFASASSQKTPIRTLEETPVQKPSALMPSDSTQKTVTEPVQKEGFFSKLAQSVTKTTLTHDEFEELFFSMEVSLLESNVAVEVIDKIKDDLSVALVQKPIPRGKVSATVHQTLENTLSEVLHNSSISVSKDLFQLSSGQLVKPFVIAVVGVNGAGKTTTIAKIAKKIQSFGLSVVCGACDTFRAGAIEQLQAHAKNVGVSVISQQYGADPTAVAFDTIQHAKSHQIDVVLLDTAGRLHSNDNLMAQLTKLKRVLSVHMTIFVGEALTGNDCVLQAQEYTQKVGIDAIVLTKADVDQKGGTALSISYVTKKPVLFLGTGQGYDDLTLFNPRQVTQQLLSSADE
jgi:fused signal recognition particle receptor